MKKTLYNICAVIFDLSLILFMLMGFVLVIGQVVGVFTNQPNMVLWFAKGLKDQSAWVSCITGFAGFFAFYLKPKKAKK